MSNQEEERTQEPGEETTTTEAPAVGETTTTEEPELEPEPEPCWCGVHHKEGSKIGKIHESGPDGPEPEPKPEPIPDGSCLLGDAPIGTNFRYAGGVYKKINHGVVQNFLNGDDATEPMDSSTIIAPIVAGHDIEPDA